MPPDVIFIFASSLFIYYFSSSDIDDFHFHSITLIIS